MKTLINKANPKIRITAPDITLENHCYYIRTDDGDCIIEFWERDWTLVEEEQPQEELVYRLNGLMQEYIKEGEDDAEKKHRFKCYQLFWDALEDADFFEQKEQKPEWSEEDEKNIGKLHRLLVICQSEKKFIPTSEYEKLDKWLKSLRPQPKRKQSLALKKIVDNLTEERLAKTRAEMKAVEDATEPVDLEEDTKMEWDSFNKHVAEYGEDVVWLNWLSFVDVARHFYELGRIAQIEQNKALADMHKLPKEKEI